MEKKLIIVDDSQMTHSIYKAFLASHSDIGVVHCYNGQEAMDALESEAGVGLVLLDLEMPVMDGYQFLRKKAERKEFKRIPVVVISWNDRKEDVDRAMDLGAYGFINKSEMSELDELLGITFGG